MKGCLGVVLGVLLFIAAGGVWDWYQGKAAADAYQQGAKERVDATIVSAAFAYGPQNLSSPAACEVRLLIKTQAVTVDADPLSGACDDNTVLQPHTEVSVEIWQGKITAIYLGNLSWPTTDNPGHENLIPQAVTFFAVVLAVPLAALLILDFALGGLIEWLRHRHLLPPARRQKVRREPPETPPPDMHVYPPV